MVAVLTTLLRALADYFYLPMNLQAMPETGCFLGGTLGGAVVQWLRILGLGFGSRIFGFFWV